MRIVFFATAESLRRTREALLKSEHDVVGVVTQPDKPAGRTQQIEPPPIKRALTPGAPGGRPLPMPILQPTKIKDPNAIEAIRALTPDVIVVMAYGQILPLSVLERRKFAC